MTNYASIYTLDNADDYFANKHLMRSRWEAFDIEVRESAVYQAERVIWLFLDNGLLTDISDYDGTETYREDFAVFEQAYWMASKHLGTNASHSGPQFMQSSEDFAEDMESENIAPEAMKWLRINRGNITIVRGS